MKHELVDLLRRERVVLNGRTILQNIVRSALVFERKRLAGALDGLLDAENIRSLDRFLADETGLPIDRGDGELRDVKRYSV